MKRRAMRAVSVLSMVLLFQGVAMGGDTLEEIEKKVVDAWSKIESLAAKMTLSMQMEAGETKVATNGEGTFEYAKKDGKTLFRNEMKMVQEFGTQPKMESSSLTIFDGEFVYSLNEGMGQKMASKSKQTDTTYGKPGGKEMFDNLRQQNELKLLPDEKVDGKEAYVIEATPKTPSPVGGIAKMKVFFLKDSGVMVKMLSLDKDGKATMTMTYSDLKINAKINPDRFVFKAPEGVQVIDMTGGGSPPKP